MPATVETRPVRSYSLRRLAVAGVVALMASGCLSRESLKSLTTGSVDSFTTGSIDAGAPVDTARRDVARLAARYEKDPADVGTAMAYAQALRATDQGAQAAAVLQQTALRNPKNPAVLAAYGKSLAEVGRFGEAAEVLRNAHSPANPDWRVLSAQGAVADQMGDHVQAQRYYEAALKIVPGEPAVLSNLGLSYALAKRLPEAESTLRQASADPRADGRVRQNLALVLGLQGRFGEAEQVLTRDLGPAQAAQNVAALRGFVSQPNAWKAIRSAEKAKAPHVAAASAM
ncbi:tetratricopeptide repeat protein [Methylobacterium currus]|nr:tetratricopeptide repeat protein [Methylobacterium currus]